MPRIDLNIVDRGIQGTEWVAEDVCLTVEHLDEVMEQKTDNSGALNSLPTPFARFFVAREAFRRAMEEHIDSRKEAGFAYRQFVSDVLDVYELLFNLKYHRNNSWRRGEKLELRQWESNENLAYLKEKMPILYNSIANYYATDIAEDRLYFVVFTAEGHDYLLACTSPLTGFVTPPDMDKRPKNMGMAFAGERYSDLHIRRKSGGEYFRDIKMFEARDADFKNYMYYELFGSDSVDARYKGIKEYIRSFNGDKDIRSDYRQKLAAVKTDQNDDLVVNGLTIKRSDEEDIASYFATSLIRVPYRIDRERFRTVTFENDSEGRNYDYLLPFRADVMSLFDDGAIDSSLHVGRSTVTVRLRYKGKIYEKEYGQEELKPGMGRIVDLNEAKINFDIALFPNILSAKESENNYFKVFVVAADEDEDAPNFGIEGINLSFFKGCGEDFMPIREIDSELTGAEFGVLPAAVRSRQKSASLDGGTKFYELFNSSFDLMEVRLLDSCGLILPIWNKSRHTGTTYTYAIDLGTSNTFMSGANTCAVWLAAKLMP